MRLRRPFVDLDDAVVVVTGATSGIGRATAGELAGRCSRVVLAARDHDALDDVARACREQGGDVLAVPTDVSDRAEVARLARATLDHFGQIDAWINDAGVMTYGRFDEVPVEEHEQVLRTNLLGAVYGAAAALPEFRRCGRGVLVNVASLYGEMSTPFVSSYVASKFGLLGLSRVLQYDLGDEPGVAVCCVMPSSVDTPIFRHAGNHRGKRVTAIPPVVAPSRVARAIVSSIEHPRREVRIGYLGRLAGAGERLVGPVYRRVVTAAMERVGFGDDDVAPQPGNLFEPADSWQQVHGGWRNPRARAAIVATGVTAAATLAAIAHRRA